MTLPIGLATVVSLALHLAVACTHATVGIASQYRPGAMEATIYTRQNGYVWEHRLPLQLPQVVGYIATCNCDEIGQTKFIRRAIPSGQPPRRWERFLVVDCGGPQLRDDGLTGCEWMEQHNILCEIGFQTALRWDVVGLGVVIEVLDWRLPSPTVPRSIEVFAGPRGPHMVIEEVYK